MKLKLGAIYVLRDIQNSICVKVVKIKGIWPFRKAVVRISYWNGNTEERIYPMDGKHFRDKTESHWDIVPDWELK